ncbi:TolA protein [Klebsiella pneumoniae]
MSEIMDLTVIEIKPEQAPALYRAGGLDAYLEQIRQAVNEVPDLTTKKGRDRVASLAAQVSRSKTAIEKPGREYLKRLKEAVRPAEAEIKRFVDACDELRDATRKPLTEWEAEQERIKAEEAMNALHAEALAMNEDFDRRLAARIESDHEMALLMNDAFDREQADKAAEAERQRIAHEEEIKRLAAAAAAREVEQRAQREREEAAHREAVLKAQAEQAERDRIAAEQKAEADKQAAIEAERRKAQEEADRIRREAEQREQARLAEEKRKADEQARREADVKHRKAVGTEIVKALLANTSLTRDQAIEVLTAVKDGRIPHTGISY